MSSAAIAMNLAARSSLEAGEIKQVLQDRLLVMAEQGLYHARKADSCLITPQVGDKVLICPLKDDCYVLAILEQAQRVRTELSVPGDLTVQAGGDVQLVSAGSIRQQAARSVEQWAPDIRQTSSQHHIISGQLSTLASTLRVQSDRIAAHAEQFEGYVQRSISKAQQVMRTVESLETLNIGNWIQTIRNTFSSRARHSQITAQEDVRVDAKRIHMG